MIIMTRFEQFNLIMDSQLTQNEKLLLLVIFRYYNAEKGYSYPTKEQIMNSMGLKNETSYYKAKKNLENNHILFTKNIKGIGNQYYINYNQLTKRMTLAEDEIPNLQIISVSDFQNVSTKRKEKTKEKQNNILISEDNPYYDYLNGGWMYCEISSDFIC